MSEHPNQSDPPSQSGPTPPAKKTSFLLNALFAIGIVALGSFVVKFMADNTIPDVPGVVLTDMHSIDDLRTRFNQDHGTPRLILLLSPT